MTNKDITIIITSFRSDAKIESCLKSINQEIKVLVIENSNNKELKDKIENKYSNVKCLLSDKNLGYAKGNNIGLKMVETKYCIILNPDAELYDNTIENFLLTAKKNPNFAIIGPYIQEDTDVSKKVLNKNSLIEVNNLKGFALFLNMKEFLDIGFFDENFFIYFEEIDLCRRLKLKNKRIYLDPTIKVKHLGGSSHNSEFNEEMELSRNWHWMWSTFYYHRKYNGYFISFIRILPKLISSLIRIIFYTFIFNSKKRKIYFQRFSGILNSMMLKNSWYRPKIF